MKASRRTYLLAAAAGLAVVVFAVVLVVVFAGGHARRPHLIARSSSPGTGAGTSGPAAAPPIPVEDARALVVRYLDDINTQNRADATTLICPAQVDDWKKKIDQSGGDFTVAVTQAVFHGATAAPGGGDALSYELAIRPRTSSEVNTTTLTFTVIGTPGAYQLCGESS